MEKAVLRSNFIALIVYIRNKENSQVYYLPPQEPRKRDKIIPK